MATTTVTITAPVAFVRRDVEGENRYTESAHGRGAEVEVTAEELKRLNGGEDYRKLRFPAAVPTDKLMAAQQQLIEDEAEMEEVELDDSGSDGEPGPNDPDFPESSRQQLLARALAPTRAAHAPTAGGQVITTEGDGAVVATTSGEGVDRAPQGPAGTPPVSRAKRKAQEPASGTPDGD